MDTERTSGPLTEKKKKGRGAQRRGLRPLPAAKTRQLMQMCRMYLKWKATKANVSHGVSQDHDIPYGPANFIKGTQAPVLRLYYKQNIISTASAAYTTVAAITAGDFLNFSDLANIFEEYRVLRGHLEYFSVSQFTMTIAAVGNNTFGGACIDYGVSSALASFDALNSHDTKKFFPLACYPGLASKPGKPLADWPLQFEKLPDEEWIATSTTTTAFCWWKPYFSAAATLSSSFTAGYLLGWMDFQFRGMQP